MENEMGTCSVHGEMRNAHKILVHKMGKTSQKKRS
jgi:hypothetical protein